MNVAHGLRQLTVSLVLAAIAAPMARAANPAWLTDLPTALTQAKASHERVFLDFTGSDWCSACIEFKKQVRDTDEFKAYAAKHLILVDVDFPDKDLPAALTKANNALKDQFKVEVLPVFVVLDETGRELGRFTGYAKQTPADFIAKLEKLPAAP